MMGYRPLVYILRLKLISVFMKITGVPEVCIHL